MTFKLSLYEGLYDGEEYNFVAYGGKARYLLLCGNRKAPQRCGAFALPGRWSEGLFSYLLFFFLLWQQRLFQWLLPLTSKGQPAKPGCWCRRSAEWCTEVWLGLQQVPEWVVAAGARGSRGGRCRGGLVSASLY